MVTATNDQRLSALEHRTDGLEQDIRDERARLNQIASDVSYMRGALTEMRWTLRVVLVLLVLNLTGLVQLSLRLPGAQ